MLIPVRCTTCGNMIGSKYKKYLRNVTKFKKLDSESQVVTFDRPNTDIYSKFMEETGIKRYCCKRHFLGQQEIIYKL
jgi:DNA-directed RNA polymerase subunit N (RpoN/RPB10)